MSDAPKPKGSWMHGRSGVLIGAALLIAFIAAGVYFSYRFYQQTGVDPTLMIAHPRGGDHPT